MLIRLRKYCLILGLFGWMSAQAGTSCGTNLEYEIVGTTLVLTSPDPTQAARMAYPTEYGVASDVPWYNNRASITSVVFPSNLVNIASWAFNECALTSVTIPENVTIIGSNAFYHCTDLTSVELSNVTSVSTKAFEGCTSLNEVVIPPLVGTIGPDAFRGCSSLASVLCRPNTAPSLGTDAFTDCASGLQICVPALGPYNSSDWNTNYGEKLTLCFLDENDEQNVAAVKINQFSTLATLRTSIDLFRTLRKAGCFNTLTLPFNVSDISASPLAGAEVYTFVGATVVDNALQLDIAPLVGSSLTAGTPYLIQWSNTGDVITRWHFTDITWDDDQKADDAGTGAVTYHGFYGKTHINDSTENGQNIDGTNHLNLFLGGNNTLYWPSDGNNASAKMLGFRAWFKITNAPATPMPIYKGMPAKLRIVSTPTGVESPSPSGEGRGEAFKELRNGQIIIHRNGKSYSITGQKL